MSYDRLVLIMCLPFYMSSSPLLSAIAVSALSGDVFMFVTISITLLISFTPNIAYTIITTYNTNIERQNRPFHMVLKRSNRFSMETYRGWVMIGCPIVSSPRERRKRRRLRSWNRQRDEGNYVTNLNNINIINTNITYFVQQYSHIF